MFTGRAPMPRFFSALFVRRHLAPRRPCALRLEPLEPRDVPSAVHPDYVRLPLGGGAVPLGSPGPTGSTPAQIRHAYGFDKIAFGGVAGDGRGTTIAIVDAD